MHPGPAPRGGGLRHWPLASFLVSKKSTPVDWRSSRIFWEIQSAKSANLTSASQPWKFSSAGPECIREKQQHMIFFINLVINKIKLFLRVITDNIHYFWHLAITYFILTRWFWVPKLKKPLRNFESWNSYFFKKLRGLDDNLVSYNKRVYLGLPVSPKTDCGKCFSFPRHLF